MGQYYFPILLKKNWKLSKQPVLMTLYSHDFDNGLKLMEHSYVGNNFVRSVQYVLANYGNDLHFVWCGDYADEVKTHYYPNGVDLYSMAGELTDSNDEHYLFVKNSIPNFIELHDYKYIINKSKKEYVIVPEYCENKWQIHPLPILCANSNGRGGGDYHSNGKEDDKYIGRWAYDIIHVSDDAEDIVGYKEIKPNFYEKW
jgi:hypothetical protein